MDAEYDAMQDPAARWAVEGVRRYVAQGRPDRAYGLAVALAHYIRQVARRAHV
jgi:hypothetical protein